MHDGSVATRSSARPVTASRTTAASATPVVWSVRVRRRTALAVHGVLVAAGLVVGGTFAWRQLNQPQWSTVPVPGPTGTSNLTSVACSTDRSCVAVADDGQVLGNGGTTTWQVASPVVSPFDRLTAAACSPLACSVFTSCGDGYAGSGLAFDEGGAVLPSLPRSASYDTGSFACTASGSLCVLLMPFGTGSRNVLVRTGNVLTANDPLALVPALR